MRMDLHHSKTRQWLGRFEIDLGERTESICVPTRHSNHADRDTDWPLHWEHAVDEAGHLRRCVACGCRHVFVRKDFPQRAGLALVILAAGASVVLFALGQVALSIGVLLAAVVVDQIIGRFTSACVVCYRCRSEFRDLEISPEIEPWNLAIGEKYRPVRVQNADESPDVNGAIT
jgi:ribosomal protein S14